MLYKLIPKLLYKVIFKNRILINNICMITIFSLELGSVVRSVVKSAILCHLNLAIRKFNALILESPFKSIL